MEESFGNLLSKNIRHMANCKGMTINELAEKAGLSVETVKNIWYMRTPDPKISTLSQIADAFGCSASYLLGRSALSDEEITIIKHYRNCGQHGKSVIELVAKYEALSVKAEREAPDKHKIPCLVPHCDITEGIVYDTCETIEIETTDSRAFVGIQINTNDWSPVYCKGDIILLTNHFPKNGEYAAFIHDGKAFIREFLEENGKYRLKCLHGIGEDIIFPRMDQVQYIGTCCGVVRS